MADGTDKGVEITLYYSKLCFYCSTHTLVDLFPGCLKEQSLCWHEVDLISFSMQQTVQKFRTLKVVQLWLTALMAILVESATLYTKY